MEWPKIILKDELPPNPDPERLPDEVYRAFAGLTLPVVTPLGNYGYWCPFVAPDEQASATGVMCSAEIVLKALEEGRPEAARWFKENMTTMASGKCEVGGEERPFMIVITAEAEKPHTGPIAHDRAIHSPERLAA